MNENFQQNLDQLIDEQWASKITAKAVQTLRNDRHCRRGLPYYKIGRSVRYRVGDILDYIEAHKIDPEAE